MAEGARSNVTTAIVPESDVSERLAFARDRRAKLLAALRAIAHEVEGGDVSRTSQVGAIRGELLDIERRIPSMEKELAAQHAEAHQRQAADTRERFRGVLAQIEAERERVADLVRGAALALGRIYDWQREAGDLVNELATAPVGSDVTGCWPADVSALRNAQRPLDPFDGWQVQYIPVELNDAVIRLKPVKEL